MKNESIPQPIMYPKIALELKEMVNIDQDMRDRSLKDDDFWDYEVDRKNTDRMKEIVNEIGWPTISNVGKNGSEDAWLLVQHADHDVTFQRYCLELMKKLPHSEINSKNIALLEDRVLLKETGEQTYGTQFDEINGEFVPKPIKDPEHVDERRKIMGLDALKAGIEDMYEKYGKPLQEQGPKLRFAHLAPDAWAELGKLKRKGWVKRSVKNPETVQQHTISARIVALEIPDLSEMEKRELLDMLEIHDWPEAINGDQIVVEEDKIKLKQLKEDKFIAEREALTKICSELGGKGQEILDLWLKFELSDDEIASLARQIDKYQAVEKAFEYERAQKIPLFIEFLEYTKPFITHPVLLAKMAVLESSYNK